METEHFERNPRVVAQLRRAASIVQVRARQNRCSSTDAEAILWAALRNQQLQGAKFRRQHPMGIYIADFWCAASRLVVEIDGDYHQTDEQQGKDTARESIIARHGSVSCVFPTPRQRQLFLMSWNASPPL